MRRSNTREVETEIEDDEKIEWAIWRETGKLRSYHLKAELDETDGPALCGAPVQFSMGFPIGTYGTDAPVKEFWCPVCLDAVGGKKALDEQEAAWRASQKAFRRRRWSTRFRDLDDDFDDE